MELLNFIRSNALILSIIFGIIISILILAIILIKLLIKNKQVLSVDFFGNKKEENESVPKNNKIDNISHALYSHKFFSSVKYNFVEKDYDFKFDLYDTLLEHGIKKEDDLLVDFKKTTANKFLSNCLFKYINDSTEIWIKSVLEEVETNNLDDKNIPMSLCDIIENLVHFTKETTRIASTIKFTYKNKMITGIPEEFVSCFCNTVNRNIEIIQRLFSSIIYTSNNSWYSKMIEILDVYELGLIYIKNSVDSTLVIMNGQMEKYVKNNFSKL